MKNIAPKNKNEFVRFIKEEWEKILSEYDIPKLIQSMRRHLQLVIGDQGGLHKILALEILKNLHCKS